MAIIEAENLIYRYRDGTEALRGLSLRIEEGARVALLGPNGAGKSTFLLHLNGIHMPQQGTLKILGQLISPQTEKWVRTKVGLVFQDPDDQVFSTTVWDDVAFGPINMGLDRSEVEKRVGHALQAVGLAGYNERAPHHLSYGEKKRVAIAGILAMEPDIIVLDEPTAYLDPKGQQLVVEILDKLNQAGKTLIIATHDVDLAAEWADQVLIIKQGRLLASGDRKLLADEELINTADLRLPIVTQVFKSVPGGPTGRPVTIREATGLITRLLDRPPSRD